MFTSLFNSVTSRRNILNLSIALSSTWPLQFATSQETTKDKKLNFLIPEDNLYAFGKLWGSYDIKPTDYTYNIRMKANTDDVERVEEIWKEMQILRVCILILSLI